MTTQMPAAQTDAERLKRICTDREWEIANGLSQTQQDQDEAFLLALVERKRKLLAECAEALTYLLDHVDSHSSWEYQGIPQAVVQIVIHNMRWPAVVDAIRSLVKEVGDA